MSQVNDFLISLVKQAQTGDTAALEALLRVFRPLVRKWSARTSLSNREDIEQELNLEIVKGVLSFKIPNHNDK